MLSDLDQFRIMVGASRSGDSMNFNGILIGSDNPQRLVDFYTKLLGKPAWTEGGYTGWQLGSGSVTVAAHSEVSGKSAHPGRIIWNIETSEVKTNFDRFRAAGATVIAEPYGDDNEGWVATFADPDDNYFQLMSPMKPAQARDQTAAMASTSTR
jgi:predicted enzyme related to lactoylglutathione lyase